jgi:hypothetical protein
VRVSNNGDSLIFPINVLINRRLKDGIDKNTIFYILNRYVEYKGKEFRDELYKREAIAEEEISRTLNSKSLDPLPVEPIHNILDMFDLEDVYNFIKQTGIVKPPAMLKDNFNQNIILNEEGSREQTYLKEDYLYLIALITILKSTLGPIGLFATIKEPNIPVIYKEFILLNFYVGHPIFYTSPFKKLLDYVKKLTDVSLLNEDEASIRIMEKMVSKDDMPYYILGSLIFQRLLLSSEVNDTDNKNLVTKIYNFVKNKIKLKDITYSSNIRLKKPASGMDEDNDSTIETYRVPTDITEGFATEFKFAYEQIDYLIRDMEIQNPEMVFEIRGYLRNLEDKLLPDENIRLTAIILKKVIDPRSVDYVPLELILNGMAVAIEWCLERGHNQIAKILSSFKTESEVHQISSSLRNLMDKELEEKLNKYYPYYRGIKTKDQVRYVSYIKEYIDQLAIMLNRYNMYTVLPVELLNTDKQHTIIDSDIKNQLAKFFIDLQEFVEK